MAAGNPGPVDSLIRPRTDCEPDGIRTFRPLHGVSDTTEAAHSPEDLVRAVRAAGISDERLLQAVPATPRAAFVPADHQAHAYHDVPISIGHGQVTTQPSLSAMMIGGLDLSGDEHVLEIGTGLGFQTALLARLAADVVRASRGGRTSHIRHGATSLGRAFGMLSCASGTAAAACRTALRTTRSSCPPRSRRFLRCWPTNCAAVAASYSPSGRAAGSRSCPSCAPRRGWSAGGYLRPRISYACKDGTASPPEPCGSRRTGGNPAASAT